MNEKIDKKQIQILAKELITHGKTKQETYEELVSKYKSRIIIADIVRYTPTTIRLNKYSIWNTLYLVFISLITLVSLMKPTIGIIWLVLLIVIVASKKFKYYYWNTILGGLIIISVLALTLYQGMDNGFETTLVMLIFALPIAVIFILAGIYIPKKITPNYIEEKEKYIDENGVTRLRLIHQFEE